MIRRLSVLTSRCLLAGNGAGAGLADQTGPRHRTVQSGRRRRRPGAHGLRKGLADSSGSPSSSRIGSAPAARSAPPPPRNADPDGYTILVNSSSHTVAPALFASLSYDAAADFSAVIPLANLPTVLFVSGGKGYATIGDFVAAAKASGR